jgi:hypothetical protein
LVGASMPQAANLFHAARAFFMYYCAAVALTETFHYLELCSTCLKEGLGRSKPATKLRQAHLHTVWISTTSKPY